MTHHYNTHHYITHHCSTHHCSTHHYSTHHCSTHLFSTKNISITISKHLNFRVSKIHFIYFINNEAAKNYLYQRKSAYIYNLYIYIGLLITKQCLSRRGNKSELGLKT